MNNAADSTSAPPAPVHQPVVALVTGGGGFVGQAVVERLRARGDTVRSFARHHHAELESLGVEQFRGDLADADAIDRAVRGCAVVFHIAAKAGAWGPYPEFHRPNVVGTQNVITACRRHGVARLVFTSSPSVIFDGTAQEGIDESAPYPRRFCSHYSASKARAEQLVLAANDQSLRTIALRPHLVWGPGDNHIVPRILAQGRAGQLRIIGRGNNRVDTTYIDNAADAHVLAENALNVNPTAAAGKAYFITNDEPRVIWEVINGILAAADLPPVTRRVPQFAALAAATILEAVHAVGRRPGEPRMTRFVAAQLATAHWFDISAAKHDLGFQPQVTITDGLQRLRRHLLPAGTGR